MRTRVRETRVSIKGRFGRGYQIADRRATHFFPAESTACAMYPPRFKWMCWRRICPEGTTLNKKSFNSFFLLIQCVYPEPDVLLLITICLIIVLALCRILVLPVMGGLDKWKVWFIRKVVVAADGSPLSSTHQHFFQAGRPLLAAAELPANRIPMWASTTAEEADSHRETQSRLTQGYTSRQPGYPGNIIECTRHQHWKGLAGAIDTGKYCSEKEIGAENIWQTLERFLVWQEFQRAKGKGKIFPKLALSAAMCDVPV